MFVQVFTTCASDNERSWLWFSDRIGGTHYFSNHNSEVEAPEPERSVRSSLSGVRRWMQVPVAFPTSPGTGLNCAVRRAADRKCLSTTSNCTGSGGGVSISVAPSGGWTSQLHTPRPGRGSRLSLRRCFRERHPCSRHRHRCGALCPSSGLCLGAGRRTAGSSGLGSDVPVRLEAHLLVKNGQISPWNTLANRL